MDTQPVAVKRMSRPLRIILFICGIIAIAVGITQMLRGVTTIFGSGSSVASKQLVQELNTAVSAANKSMLEGHPMFQKLLNDVDSQGLAKVRQEQKAVVQTVVDLFGRSAAQFILAAKKSTEAAQQESSENMKSYYALKAQTYEFSVTALTINQEIARLVADESIVNMEDLVAKAVEAGKRRDAAQKRSRETEAKADAIIKAMKDNPK